MTPGNNSTPAPGNNPPKNLGEDRQSFLARVRRSLGRTEALPPTEPAPAVDETLVRLGHPSSSLVDQFATQASATNMVVHRCSESAAAAKLVRLLRDSNARRIVMGAGDLEEKLGLRELFAAVDIETVRWQEQDNMDVQFDVDAGITEVHAAIAETGTIVCSSDAGHGRGLSLVPPVHIALVRETDIVPDMIDYWARFENVPNTQHPSSQALITGPSKTADIEGELIQGVHGPGVVHIIIIESS